jgi:hypothetical protein
VRKAAKSSCDLTGSEDHTTAHDGTTRDAPALVVAPAEMDQKSISELIRFFKLLDKWDHEVTNGKVV